MEEYALHFNSATMCVSCFEKVFQGVTVCVAVYSFVYLLLYRKSISYGTRLVCVRVFEESA